MESGSRDCKHGVLGPIGAVFLLAFMLGAPAAVAQTSYGNGDTTGGIDPRRQTNTSKVASEVVTTNETDISGDENRVNDSYEPKGIDLGKFLLYPELITSLGYNSNIYVTQTNDKSDQFASVDPSFRLRSQFDTHELNVSGELQELAYERYERDDQLNARIAADGRYDIFRDTSLTGYFTEFSQHEDRGSPDTVNGLEPTPLTGNVLTLGGKTEAGPWIYSAEATRFQVDYQNVPTSTGTIIPDSLRDRVKYTLTGRIGYELSPGYYAIGQMSGDWVDYDHHIAFNNIDRSSQGYAAQAGFAVDLTQLIRGDFLIGYYKQDFNTPLFRSPGGLSIKALFNWSPTRTILIVPAVERQVLESVIAGSSSIVETSGTVLARYEFRRNIIVSGFAGLYYDDYQLTSGTAWTYDVRGSVTYAFTPELFVGADIEYRDRSSQRQAIINSYAQTIATARIGLRM